MKRLVIKFYLSSNTQNKCSKIFQIQLFSIKSFLKQILKISKASFETKIQKYEIQIIFIIILLQSTVDVKKAIIFQHVK